MGGEMREIEILKRKEIMITKTGKKTQTKKNHNQSEGVPDIYGG